MTKNSEETKGINIDSMLQERFLLLPAPLQHIIKDESFQKTLMKFSNSIASFSDSQKKALRNELLLVLFLYTSLKDAPESITNSMEIEIDKATELINEFVIMLPNDIKSLIARPLEKNITITGAIDSTAETNKTVEVETTKEIPKPDDNAASDLKKVQAIFENKKNAEKKNSVEKITKVEPLRTMKKDAAQIHGYGAFRGIDPADEDSSVTHTTSQDTVLKGDKLTNTPSYTKGDKKE